MSSRSTKLALFGGPKAVADAQALRSSWRGKGMEAALSEYTGAQYVRCVSSGTAALISSLMAADVGPGDEVLTVSYTWVATVGAVLRVNATPVFVDIDPRTLCMDVEDAARKVTARTKAILPVDFYGHPAPVPELMRLAAKHGLMVIEDACQAATAEIDGVKVGNIAHLTAFSWSGKPIYASGGGGAYLTNDRVLYERALLAGQHPTVIAGLATDPDVRRYASMGGTGENMRSVGSADALNQLLDADVRTDARVRNCEYLTEALRDVPGVTPPYVRPGYKHAYHYYTCLWDSELHGVSRDRFCEALNAEGVYAVAYIKDANYRFAPESKPIEAGGPIHLRTMFRERAQQDEGRWRFRYPYLAEMPVYREGDLPVSEEMADREFCLSQPDLSPPCDTRDMQLIVAAIGKVVDHVDELKE